MRILAVTTLRNEAPLSSKGGAYAGHWGDRSVVYTMIAVMAQMPCGGIGKHGILHHIIQDLPQGVSAG